LDADDNQDDPTKPGNGEPEAAASGLEAVEMPAETPIEALRRERDELKDQVLRRRAEFENYRKRVDRDKEQATVDARAQILSGLLPTIDNFERALQAPPAHSLSQSDRERTGPPESTSGGPKDDSSLRSGVELIYRNLVTFLESQGVAIKDPTGETFDPQIHQALMHEEVPGAAEGTIVETFRKGYFLKDRLLRPALVKVAKGADEDGSSEESSH
jgi:molecular chaperone GrpE